MIILGVDFGEARTGLAICDRSELLASPVGTIAETDFDTCVEKVAAAAKRTACSMYCGRLSQKYERHNRRTGRTLPAVRRMPERKNKSSNGALG